ncbi:hypothetical protein [Nakamurella flava]|uniref:hypothetical protein n=1 Tax=Nakamurella flava TaxID=2576308 RepID=UPI00140AB0EF|nr:hypothetical protein [Nakamurella flava]
MSTPRSDDPGYTEQGEAAEQSAFRGEGEYSGGGFAGGPEELTGADGDATAEDAGPTDH